MIEYVGGKGEGDVRDGDDGEERKRGDEGW